MAKTPAEQLRFAVEEAVKQGRVEGYATGFETGSTEGLEAGLAEGLEKAYSESMANENELMNQFRAELEELIVRIGTAMDVWYAQCEQAVADLAIDVVRKLLACELATSRDSAVAIAKESLACVTHAKLARIVLDPTDLSMVEQRKSEVMAAASSVRKIEWAEGEGIGAGCVIESDGGEIDARVETRLELVEQAWEDAA